MTTYTILGGGEGDFAMTYTTISAF